MIDINNPANYKNCIKKQAHLKANGYFNEQDFETSFNKVYRSNHHFTRYVDFYVIRLIDCIYLFISDFLNFF